MLLTPLWDLIETPETVKIERQLMSAKHVIMLRIQNDNVDVYHSLLEYLKRCSAVIIIGLFCQALAPKLLAPPQAQPKPSPTK